MFRSTKLADVKINKAKEEKFKELAESRVTKAIKAIELIGNLGNKNNYSYSEQDVKKIFNALSKSINTSKAKFNTKNGHSRFNL